MASSLRATRRVKHLPEHTSDHRATSRFPGGGGGGISGGCRARRRGGGRAVGVRQRFTGCRRPRSQPERNKMAAMPLHLAAAHKHTWGKRLLMAAQGTLLFVLIFCSSYRLFPDWPLSPPFRVQFPVNPLRLDQGTPSLSPHFHPPQPLPLCLSLPDWCKMTC